MSVKYYNIFLQRPDQKKKGISHAHLAILACLNNLRCEQNDLNLVAILYLKMEQISFMIFLCILYLIPQIF